MNDKAGVLVDRREMLRVKAKSLADEARIIRREERRAMGQLREELRLHRVNQLRGAARATFLAYGIVKGRSVDVIEVPGSERSPELWKSVRAMVEKYGPVKAADKNSLLERCRD